MSAACIRRSLLILRIDAKERGMTDITLVYGWSAIRLGQEMLAAGERFNDPKWKE
jgi:hypothetical protein